MPASCLWTWMTFSGFNWLCKNSREYPATFPRGSLSAVTPPYLLAVLVFAQGSEKAEDPWFIKKNDKMYIETPADSANFKRRRALGCVLLEWPIFIFVAELRGVIAPLNWPAVAFANAAAKGSSAASDLMWNLRRTAGKNQHIIWMDRPLAANEIVEHPSMKRHPGPHRWNERCHGVCPRGASLSSQCNQIT